MKKFRTNTVVSFNHGTVKLTEAQASARTGKVSPIEGRKGIYEILDRITFKNGEEFGYEGELSRSLAECLDEDGKADDAAAKIEALTAKATEIWAKSDKLKGKFPNVEDFVAQYIKDNAK